MLTAAQLLDALLERARAPRATETVAVTGALGRVLAAPVRSAITVPPLDNSAMDGYAVRVADVPAAGTRLPVSAGSGITAANAATILPLLDGAIVGSSLKEGGVWWNGVELSRVEALVAAVRPLRDAR